MSEKLYTIWVVYRAKWWKRPLLWVLGRPTHWERAFIDCTLSDVTLTPEGGSYSFTGMATLDSEPEERTP